VTSSPAEITPRYLTADREQRLATILKSAGDRRPPADVDELVREVAKTLEATILIAQRPASVWTILASSAFDRALPSGSALSELLARRRAARDPISVVFAPESGKWSAIPMTFAPSGRAMLLIAGDWRLSGPPLLKAATTLSALLRKPISSASVGRATHRLANRLARTRGIQPVSKAIVEHMARLVNARYGSIALAEPGERLLTFKATYGYPLVLVEHVKVQAGAGILGSVFESGQVLHVEGDSDWPSMAGKRKRYRTASFVAVPIKSGEDVLAVVSVADRSDGQPFSAADVRALRALTGPAALALAREGANARAEAYAHAAAVDPVSGLFNRRYFHLRLDGELQRSRRHQIPVALLMLDLDDFKRVNDTYGHLVGDAMIRETAEVMRRSVRVFDICTRFGGEEFGIIMPGTSPTTAAIVAERIRDRMEGYRSPDARLRDLSLTVSIGIAASTAATGPRELIERADQALYLAKRSGKNQVKLYEE
jgi:diguanylate cyclase (GGDEF)-like protein